MTTMIIGAIDEQVPQPQEFIDSLCRCLNFLAHSAEEAGYNSISHIIEECAGNIRH